jgi:hypothetical protein
MRRLTALWMVATALLLMSEEARAGCGCDHPAPAWTVIAPPFASPGKAIRVHADGASFVVGRSYKVDFGGSAVVELKAKDTGFLSVVVPPAVGSDPGPKKLKVQGKGYDREYSDALFTALPPAAALPATGGRFGIRSYLAAVAKDGTLLLPLDVRAILSPTQLSVMVVDRPLSFGAEDVVIYNADGVDLTLFTLTATDAVERQWGSYYGWRVEDDTGLHGDVYEHQVLGGDALDEMSDVLSYWRHEFYTYAAAHGPFGTHSVDVNGRHLDGTLHIDHGQLVLAIGAVERDDDGDESKPLNPGKLPLHLLVTAAPAPGPQEAGVFLGEIAASLLKFPLVFTKPERQLVPLR